MLEVQQVSPMYAFSIIAIQRNHLGAQYKRKAGEIIVLQGNNMVCIRFAAGVRRPFAYWGKCL